MLKRGIGVGLLFVAGHAYSAGEIIVNTTADEVKNDNLCSLREAIEYINQGMLFRKKLLMFFSQLAFIIHHFFAHYIYSDSINCLELPN